MFPVSVQGEAARTTRLGRYELITRIGQGGMAEVQLALQRGPAGFEKLVVVKLVHEPLATQKAFVDMLLDEARVAALVKHPNVVDIYDLGQAEGRYFIAMEYLEGEPLLAVLRAGREGKRLDPLSTGRLIADTAEGLDAAHELRSMSGERIELVHHDISLGNIVVLYNGQVKLVDFGVAKATQSASPGAKVHGKFSYMAPEKLRGSQGDRRSDIFSLGCVMWEALTLKRLFRGGNDAETMRQVLELPIQPPSKVNGEVPPEYDRIVMRALDRDPDKRQLTAKEMAVEIEELLRKRGYGAKNDRIAKYMQETFRDHIDARKHLVQEVVAKGSASAEVLTAAFNEELASGTPGTAHRSDFTLGKVVQTPASGVAPQPASGVPEPAASADASGATVVGKPPWEVHTNVSAPPIDPDGGETVFQPPLAPWQTVLADPNKRKLIAGGGGLVVLVLIIAIAKCGGGGKKQPAAAAVPSDAAEVAVAPPAIDAAAAPAAIDAGVAVAPPVDAQEIEMPGTDVGHGSATSATPVRRPPPPAGPDAEALYKQGVQAMVRGETKTAITALTKATRIRPGFAPAWRVLGQVYKKNGDKGQAKAAFQRYLSIAPNAPDAPQIRDQIKSL
jgi:serine/threonine-protein kinase